MSDKLRFITIMSKITGIPRKKLFRVAKAGVSGMFDDLEEKGFKPNEVLALKDMERFLTLHEKAEATNGIRI